MKYDITINAIASLSLGQESAPMGRQKSICLTPETHLEWSIIFDNNSYLIYISSSYKHIVKEKKGLYKKVELK